MDADLLYLIFLVAISVISSVISSSKKKSKKADEEKNAVLSQFTQPKKDKETHIAKQTNHKKEKRKTIAAKEPIITMAQANATLPVEGQRVTSIPKSAPMAPNPVSRSPLHDKETLKRALIYGEILTPKFR